LVAQFLYGEDALDVTRLMYLTKFDFSVRNYRALLSKYRPEIALQVVEASKGAAPIGPGGGGGGAGQPVK